MSRPTSNNYDDLERYEINENVFCVASSDCPIISSCKLTESLSGSTLGDLKSHYDLARQPSAASNFAVFGRAPLSHQVTFHCTTLYKLL